MAPATSPRALGAETVCTFDVGGTTTDVALLTGAAVPASELTEVGELEIPHPSVPLRSFGLGGGSLIVLDDEGELRVGPRSAVRPPALPALAWAGRR